ncbi:hypothetical protein F4X90_07265 [Candidatus Poribacteria bacterium]|nr:hypothetical protein [Candidatus Poribacteria bacterium]
MSLPDPTLENLVDALRLSNKPNIVVEGQDDEIIYGTLVERLGRFDVGFFSAGSKDTLLHLYEELAEYENAGTSGMSLSLLFLAVICGCSGAFQINMTTLF